MKRKIISFVPNTLSYKNKKEGKMNKKSFISLLGLVFLMSLILAISAYGVSDKLIVKDAAGTSNVFTVQDSGNVNVTGTDSNNAFQLKIMGHSGGVSHAQIVTDQPNSRLSFLAGSASDYAPRFQIIAGQDDTAAWRGWAIFDYGSFLNSLPSAEFKVRYIAPPSTYAEMIRCVGGSKVLFPTGQVAIGTDSPNANAKLDVNGPIYQRGVRIHADYVFNNDYKIESIEQHAKFMWQNKHLKAIPSAQKDENGMDIVEIGANERGIVEELEKAHIYIEQLNNKVKELESKIESLEKNK
jgi:hypothetical protein